MRIKIYIHVQGVRGQERVGGGGLAKQICIEAQKLIAKQKKKNRKNGRQRVYLQDTIREMMWEMRPTLLAASCWPTNRLIKFNLVKLISIA